jgi:hypothetical protein
MAAKAQGFLWFSATGALPGRSSSIRFQRKIETISNLLLLQFFGRENWFV